MLTRALDFIYSSIAAMSGLETAAAAETGAPLPEARPGDGYLDSLMAADDDTPQGGNGPYRSPGPQMAQASDPRRLLEGADWERLLKEGAVAIDVAPFGPLLGMDDLRAAYELDGNTDGPAAQLILELQECLSKTSKSIRLMRDARQDEIRHLLSYRRLPGFVDFRQTVRGRDGTFDRLRLLDREIGDLMEQGQPVEDRMQEYKRVQGYLGTAFQPGWHYAVLRKELRAARRRLDANPIPDGPERIRRGIAEERLPVAWEILPDIVRHQVALTMPWEMTSNAHYGTLMDRITADVVQGANGMSEDVLRRLFRSEIEDRGVFIRGMAPESLILLVFGRLISGKEGLGRDEVSALSRRIKERESQFRSDDIVQSIFHMLRHSGRLAK